MIARAEDARRWREGLCGWCAEPLPEERAYLREFCDVTCRSRAHRARSREQK